MATRPLLGNTAYGRCVVDAQTAFGSLRQADVAPWDSLTAAYARQGDCASSVQLYEAAAAYVFLLTVCNDAGLVKHAERMKNLRKKEAAWTERGQSWIWDKQKVQSFLVGNCKHPQHKLLYELLGVYGLKLKNAGHIQFYASHPVVWQRRSWVNNWYKPNEVYPRVAILSTQLRSLRSELQHCSPPESSRSEDELRSLCEQGQLDRAVASLLLMDQRTVPSVNTYLSLLKACTKRKALVRAKEVYAHIALHGLEGTRVLGENVVNTLVKCGSLEDAIAVFDHLPHRSAFSWTAVIAGYSASGQGREALQMYQQMQEEGVQPNAYTFVSLLKACGSMGDLKEGKRIHAHALKCRFGTDLYICTGLIDMYGKCRSILDAQNVFDKLSYRDVVSWNAMLAAYIQQGDAGKALGLYDQMHKEGVSPSNRTFVSALQACGMLLENGKHSVVDGQCLQVKCLERGRSIHADLRRKGYESDIYVGSTLVSMYGKCGSIEDAKKAFDGLPQRNVVSWNAMLAAYVEQGQGANALQLYVQMQEKDASPDAWTYVSALQACSICWDMEDAMTGCNAVKYLKVGEAIHVAARRKGYDSDTYVGNALVTMYGKCGSIPQAHSVFNELPHRDVVSWNAMLTAYLEQGLEEEALQLYTRMQEEGVSPDSRTFVSLVQACGMLGEKEENVMVDRLSSKVRSLEKGKAIHVDICRKGYDSDVFVGNALVSMYGKCGSIDDAQKVFYGLPQRNVVAWTAMLAAHVEQGQGEKALQLYRQMQQEGTSPDEITSLLVLQACSNTGSLDVLKQLHHTLIFEGNCSSPVLATTLISAYGRCGSMVDGQAVFDALPEADVVSWNALIASYARQGNYARSLQCYEEMQVEGVNPDGVTFLSLLSVCSHAGLVDKGVAYFEAMCRDHCITAEIGHYICMVDLLGRAGYFTSIEHMLSEMPIQPDLALWLSVLGACRKHGKVAHAERAFDSAVHLEPRHAAAYILMSHIYMDAGLWDRAKEVEGLRQKCL